MLLWDQWTSLTILTCEVSTLGVIVQVWWVQVVGLDCSTCMFALPCYVHVLVREKVWFQFNANKHLK